MFHFYALKKHLSDQKIKSIILRTIGIIEAQFSSLESPVMDAQFIEEIYYSERSSRNNVGRRLKTVYGEENLKNACDINSILSLK
ncbi:hypothetical protein CEXT_579351 [Caerostris extrusa]|uniref:Uncharacterized protein n=1 Tax=Caerostris extrusa TaxID=172846 RepID=A0AAV4XJ25_CAEEX|nr:hypothetical protein CEXT_579351 [Caerostris extrusa]